MAAVSASRFIHISKITLRHVDQMLTPVCSKVLVDLLQVERVTGMIKQLFIPIPCVL